MEKPIQETIFKSRLTITYRANVSGTPQQENLPYRLLVLGEFSGRAMRADQMLPDLASREVKSVKRGTTVNDHLAEMIPSWKISDDPALKGLKSRIPGKVTFTHVTCNIPLGAIERNESGNFLISGRARFSSTMAENGLCDLTGELRVWGTVSVDIKANVPTIKEPKLLVSGAVVGHYADPATGKPTGILTAFIEDKPPAKADAMKMVPDDDQDHAPPDGLKVKPFLVQLDPLPASAERSVPFPSISAFSPDAIAEAIPELRRLKVIKQLLTELQSGLRNRPELRKLVKTLLPAYGTPTAEAQKMLEPFDNLKKWAEEAYPLLKIARPAAAKQGSS